MPLEASLLGFTFCGRDSRTSSRKVAAPEARLEGMAERRPALIDG